MNNIIKILIVAVASAWAMPMPAAPADKNKDNDPTWMANHAKGDTAKTDANAVAPLPDDTLPKEKVVPVDDAGSEAEADTSTAATDEEQGEDKAEKKETASALWYLALIWLIVLTAGMAYVFYTVYKRLENHSKALHKFKDDQARVAASVNGGSSALDARLKDMEGTLASLRTENDRLKTKVSSLESAVKDLTAGGRTVSGTHNTGRQGTGPQLRKATDSDEETYYVDTLNIGGDGTLTIPLQILKEQNSGELFMVKANLEKGTATYTINPKAANLMGQVTKLQKFCDGLAVVRGSNITVETPGKLSREGYDLKVINKLIVKSE